MTKSKGATREKASNLALISSAQAHRNNFQHGEHVERQNKTIRMLKQAIDELDIKCHTNTTRGVVVPNTPTVPNASGSGESHGQGGGGVNMAQQGAAMLSAARAVQTMRI